LVVEFLVYAKEKNVRVTMEFEISKRHTLKPTLFTIMVQQVLWWERQQRCYDRKRQGSLARNIVIINTNEIILGKKNEDKRRQTNWSNLIFLKLLFLNIFKKIPAHSLFGCMGHSS